MAHSHDLVEIGNGSNEWPRVSRRRPCGGRLDAPRVRAMHAAHRHTARAGLAIAATLTALHLSCPIPGQTPDRPVVELDPAGSSLVGDPISVRVSGLPPGQPVVLFSQMVDRYGRLWTGEATFTSSSQGVVDPARQAPTDAAWEGVDPIGPFWALARKTARGAHPEPEDGDAERIAISALVDGRAVATAAVVRWYRRPDVEELPVDADGLAARLFVTRNTDPRPAVIVLPGSGGGIPVVEAQHLASHGYAALALGYFGEPGVPKDLELVPLEYFDRAIDWLAAHPRADASRVGLLGVSKGGELSLLVASRRPEIKAVVAAVPSSVVFQSIADDWPRTSSWSLAGEGVPFVPYVVSSRYRETGRLSILYEDSLQDEQAVAAAAIPVEKIAGPMLLITGRDDWMWPSTAMCEQIERRLADRGFSHNVVHLAYDDVGHEVANFGYRPVSWTPRVGGTPQGHAQAQADLLGKDPGVLGQQSLGRAGTRSSVRKFLASRWSSPAFPLTMAARPHVARHGAESTP